VQDRELVRPGREPALAAEVVELAEHRDAGVVGALERQIVEVVGAQRGELPAAAVQLEAGAADEQRMQLGDRCLARGARRAQVVEQTLRLVVARAGVGWRMHVEHRSRRGHVTYVSLRRRVLRR
jgi:hypothetical protein